MIRDNVVAVATTIASIHASEAARAQIALETLEAIQSKSKVAEVAKKYGVSVREANRYARSYYNEAQRLIKGMSLPNSTRKVVFSSKSMNQRDDKEKEVLEHDLPEERYVDIYLKCNGNEKRFVKEVTSAENVDREYALNQYSRIVMHLVN